MKKCKRGYFFYNIYDEVVGRSLKEYGQWCDEELQLLESLVHFGQVVIDVGAYIGTHTVALAKTVGSGGAVFAFEPQRLAHQLLQTNLTVNGLCHVTAYPIALSDKSGSILMPVQDGYSWENGGNYQLTPHSKGEEIKIRTLDSFHLNQCHLIKIDVEGMELKVLKGASDTIKKYRPFLYIENNSYQGSNLLFRELEKLHYVPFWHLPNYFDPQNAFHNPTNIFEGGVRPFEVNLICFPKENIPELHGIYPIEDLEDNWLKLSQRLHLPVNP